MTAAYTRNRCYNRREGKIPFEAISAQRPNVSGMLVFGSVCFAYVQDKKKLDARCEQGVFVGYHKESPAYLVYFPKKDVVRKVRCVSFTGLDREDQYENEDEPDLCSRFEPTVKGKNSDQKVSEETGTQEPVNDKAEDTNVKESSRYPQRERRAPAYLNDYATDHVNVVDHQVHVDFCYRLGAYPQTYREAVQSADSERWKSAMENEMNYLRENNTFTLTQLPEGRKTVGGR